MNKQKNVRTRYGIGEWYGKLFSYMTTDERRELARVQFLKKSARPSLACPFRSTETSALPCTKEGGVCSIRLYAFDPATRTAMVAEGEAGQLVSTCPQRFKQSGTVYRWVGETVLGTDQPLIVGEVPFL